MSANTEYSPMTNWPDIDAFTPTHHNDSYPFISPVDSDMNGKSVLITGASKGIGRATALSFVKAGCSKIAIAARSNLTAVKAEIKTTAQNCKRPIPQVLCLELDVTSEQSVALAAEKIATAFGSLDVLFNNAGVLEAMVPFTESDPTEWWRTWEVNIKGMYLVTRALMPLLLKSETKTVVNNSSSGAHMLLFMGYQTAKVAVTRMTEFMAAHYGQSGLVAMSIHPGTIKTGLGDLVSEEFDHLFTDTLELPGDTLVWLCKEKREWLNGRFVSVNWDMEELDARKEDIVTRNLFKFRLTV